ncbi:hypothetical protein QJR52_06225 [Clostridium baratii]|uniref:hypothetical protein n=1 Tax=Clostridium baratii TaxID=1561 RepID=UPI0030CDC0A8
MRKEEILTALNGLNMQLNLLIDRVKKMEDPLELSKEEQIRKDAYARNVIKKFVTEKGCTLDKALQQELFNKSVFCNWRKISLVKLMRELNINFSYIQDKSKDWKDIIIKEFIEEEKNKAS